MSRADTGAGSRGSPTRTRILDGAERLFGEGGYAGTSLRAITRDAGVNLAAVHYHFGSKEGLLRAVLTRRVEPINQERLARLRELEAGPGAASVEEILRAFVAPPMRRFRDDPETARVVMRFFGRSRTEPTELVQGLVEENFSEVFERFVGALGRALPSLDPPSIAWRMKAVVGVMTMFLAECECHAGWDLGDGADLEALVDRILEFVTPGMLAPSHR